MSSFLYSEASFDKLVSLIGDLYRYTKTLQRKRKANQSWLLSSQFKEERNHVNRLINPHLYYHFTTFDKERNVSTCLEVVLFHKTYFIHCYGYLDYRPHMPCQSELHVKANLYGGYADLESAVNAWKMCLYEVTNLMQSKQLFLF